MQTANGIISVSIVLLSEKSGCGQTLTFTKALKLVVPAQQRKHTNTCVTSLAKYTSESVCVCLLGNEAAFMCTKVKP